MAEKKVVKKAGLKNVRQNKKRRARNIEEKKNIKTFLKAARVAIAGQAKEAMEKITKAISVLDKAAERGIIHANKASRLKSRLNLAYNKTKK
jgi:small subunit ribosomal protein S20